jgi:hypothetical protein
LRVRRLHRQTAVPARTRNPAIQRKFAPILVERILLEAVVSETSRRGFLSTLGALAGSAVIPGAMEGQPASQGGGWDMSWLDRLTGKHKQVFDFTNPTMLQVMRNWLDAHEQVYGLKVPDLSAVVGIGSPSFPVNATDAMYEKYPIGTEWKITDPTTGKPAMRNIFLDGTGTTDERENSVRALQRRGVIFWQCNNALKRVATQLANAVQRPQPEVYAELRASGLNPGVILVPAHTMLIGLCQERGCAYEKI